MSSYSLALLGKVHAGHCLPGQQLCRDGPGGPGRTGRTLGLAPVRTGGIWHCRSRDTTRSWRVGILGLCSTLVSINLGCWVHFSLLSTRQMLQYPEQQQRISIKMLEGLERQVHKKQLKHQGLFKAFGYLMIVYNCLTLGSLSVDGARYFSEVPNKRRFSGHKLQ